MTTVLAPSIMLLTCQAWTRLTSTHVWGVDPGQGGSLTSLSEYISTVSGLHVSHLKRQVG